MPIASTVSDINTETMAHAPAALGTILAVENAIATSVPGDTKAQIVINSVLAGAQVAGTDPNVTVASVAGLVTLFVSILNAAGVFKHAKK